MGDSTIDLIYFDGCPNLEAARENLRAAVGAERIEGEWREWNLHSDNTPDRFKRFGSPTILVDGEDVTGEQGGDAAMACRVDGAPSVAAIREALKRGG